jgi:BirA family biotin operon repressor/biotin-[acetyl-CoA-carboxylase] ligase
MNAPSQPGTEHLHWGAEALWRQLEPLLPGVGVEVVARLESTNSVLMDRARQSGGRRSDDARPCLLVAEHQTRGRGRQGRTWQSWPGTSLTLSLGLPLAPPDWSGLSLAVGLMLADALDPLPPGDARMPPAPRIGLKWPNDLWLWAAPGQGRKLGGILIETVSVGARRLAVVGVGLNVLPQALDGLSQGYACLQELDPAASAPAALARVAPAMARGLLRFEQEGLRPFLDGYARRDVLAGQPVRTEGAQALDGVADGVDPDGALRLAAATGTIRVVSGEVSVRLAGDAAANPDVGRP